MQNEMSNIIKSVAKRFLENQKCIGQNTRKVASEWGGTKSNQREKDMF